VPGPESLIEGVDQAAVEALGITSLSHRSALHRLSPFNGTAVVDMIYLIEVDPENWTGC
jgi:hypothetical protein